MIPKSERSAGEGIGYPLQYSWVSLVAQQQRCPGRWNLLNQSHCLHTLHPSGWKPFPIAPVDNRLRSRDCAARDIRESQPLSRVGTVFPPDSSSCIKKKKIGEQLLYNVVLVSAVQQSESALSIHVPSLLSLPPSHLSRSSQSTKLSSLCHTATSH